MKVISSAHLKGGAAMLAVMAALTAAHAEQVPDGSASNSAEAQSSDQSGIQDIIVTARRSQEQLQSTPVAVTALTPAALDRAQITDMFQVQYSTPGLIVAQGAGNTGAAFSLRGQAQTSSDSASDQSVGLYIDGVYIARQQGALVDLVDVQRIEVLRGPQGTLFGRNTTGGAVSITTKEPEDTLGGSIKVGIGNYNQREATGIINVPLTESLSVRFLAKHVEHSGYGRNIFLNKDVADLNTELFRGAIKFAPRGSSFSLIVRGDYTTEADAGQLTHLRLSNPATAALPASLVQPYINAGFYTNGSDLDVYNRFQTWGASAVMSVDIGSATLKTTSAYRGFKRRNLTDFDSSPAVYFSIYGATDHDQFSQEIQLSGQSGALSWIGGAFYFYEKAFERYSVLEGALVNGAHVRNESVAPYLQANYQVNDALRVTAGVRYSWDSRHIDDAYRQFNGACLIKTYLLDDGVTCSATRSASFHYPSYTLSADYRISPELFVYARTSRSNKSGGISKGSTTLETFSPERVTDYEIGMKADLFDRRLRINVDGFWAQFQNMQRPVTSDALTGLPATIIQSIGKSRIPGVEVEVTALPIPALELTGSFSRIFPKYIDFSDLTGDRRGEPFPFVAKQTYNLGATYTITANYGTYSIHADYAHQSAKYYFPNERSREPGYGLLNARISLKLDRPGVELALWARNLTKEKYNNFIGDYYASGPNVGYPGDPRTFGGTLTYTF